MKATTASAVDNTGAPANAQRVLITLVIVAAVANLPLAMANVGLPSIGKYFNVLQVQLNPITVADSLGLACSVLWLGALDDRYGRKQMAIIGVSLAIPAALISGFAPNVNVLFFGRLFGGFTAGMAYPTTLALIAALYLPPHPLDRRSPAGRADFLARLGLYEWLWMVERADSWYLWITACNRRGNCHGCVAGRDLPCPALRCHDDLRDEWEL